MTQPIPSTQRTVPAADAPATEEPEVAVDEQEGDEVEAEAPLNRAARRARAKGNNPSHVGPQAGRTDQGRGPRSHTKRQIG